MTPPRLQENARVRILARILFLVDTNRDLFNPPAEPDSPPGQSEYELALWRAFHTLIEDRWPQLKEHDD